MASLRVERQGGVVRITLDRAARANVLDADLAAGLAACLEGLAADATTRAVVLTGAGGWFSAGADPDWLGRAGLEGEGASRAAARALERLLRALDDCPKPTLAVVNGAAHGVGLGLVAACDIAVAADTAWFAADEVCHGLLAGVAAPFVLRALGARQGRRYLLTGERLDASAACRLGLVHEVVPAAELERRAGDLLRDLLRGGPEALAGTKRLVRLVEAMPQGGSIRAEAMVALAAARLASAEGREGIAARLERRRPAWLIDPDEP